MLPEGPAHSFGLPAIGQILAGKYELVRLLGEGGMAFIYEATHLRLRQRVAIKLLAPDMARDPELVARFDHEARAVWTLRTPHVARVMDVDTTDDGLPFIVMEFLEGRDLEGELAARHRLPVDEAVDYILQACAAMLEAHENGIVHRDLKPANLFLVREGEDRIVKVLDFGISKVVGEMTRLTGAGAVLGTVLYMSPEQIRASKDVDQRADIWSLGVILFELVAGRPPWEGSTHQIATAIMGKTAPDVRTFAPAPEPLAGVIANMLQRDASRRIATVTELVLALGPYARAESLGGTIAAQLALGSTGARIRAISKREGRAVKSVTMPMMPGAAHAMLRPAAASAPATAAASASTPFANATPTTATAPTAPPATAPTPLPSARPRKKRSLRALAVLVALAGAVGVMLTAAVLWRARASRVRSAPIATYASAAASPDADSSVGGSADASASATPAAAKSSPGAPPPSEQAAPAPPPTGTAIVRRSGARTSTSATPASPATPAPPSAR